MNAVYMNIFCLFFLEFSSPWHVSGRGFYILSSRCCWLAHVGAGFCGLEDELLVV